MIGEGESGDVFSARTLVPLAGQPPLVAIKVVRLPASPGDDSSRLEKLNKELALWRDCAHSRVLSLYGVFFHPEQGVWVRAALSIDNWSQATYS